jgi:hypothetical protein
MSNTSLSALNMLYQHILHSVLLTDAKKPNGKLCKLERPLNSVLEDVVINSLGLNREDVQEGVFNVNVYVPNLKLLRPNDADKSQPDTARLLYLSTLANTALGEGEEIWEASGNYCFKLQQDQLYQDENNQHYMGYRVEFYLQNN